jgi:hypothetical protein
MWIAEGKPLERAVELALGWNSRNDPPLPEEKVQKTCASILQTHLRNHPQNNWQRALAPLFDPASASVTAMLTTPHPPRRWLVEDLLPLDVVAMIVGQGASSKSNCNTGP